MLDELPLIYFAIGKGLSIKLFSSVSFNKPQLFFGTKQQKT